MLGYIKENTAYEGKNNHKRYVIQINNNNSQWSVVYIQGDKLSGNPTKICKYETFERWVK